MTDATPAAPAAPAPAKTIGQDIDAELAVVKARLAVLEADGKTAWSDVVAWGKAQWPHFVTWAGTAAALVKTGVIHLP